MRPTLAGTMRVSVAIFAVGGGGIIACGMSRLPAPSYVEQPTSALTAVPYPPPPARVETVPKQPREEAVWIDGEWLWQGRRWAWKPGRWVVVPTGARFAPWTSVRDKTGGLYVAMGVFRDPKGSALEDPTPLLTARARSGPLVSPEGDLIEAPTLRPEQLVDASADGGEDGGLSDASVDASFDAGDEDAGDASVDGGPLPLDPSSVHDRTRSEKPAPSVR